MLPQVVRRLVIATILPSRLRQIDFPAHESAQRSGFDGVVTCDEGNAWVPTGRSVWELGVGDGVKAKADEDYNKRTAETSEADRKETVFVFVTPRHWEKKAAWVNEKSSLGHWKDVRAYDADDLEQWMETTLTITVWFGGLIGARPDGAEDIRSRWSGIAASTDLPLLPELFLVGREKSLKRIRNWFDADASLLTIEARSPVEVIDFFCAAVSAMEEAQRVAIESRTVIVGNAVAWRAICSNPSPAMLVLDPIIELSPEEIGRALTNNHHVLIAKEFRRESVPGEDALEAPGEQALARALEHCGISPVEAEQHARACGGSLAILKRRLTRFPLLVAPEWAETLPSNTAIPCLLLGGWDGKNPADCAAVERLSGRRYKDLEPEFQRLATCKDPLLLHAAGKWRLISKDEAWTLLGDHVAASNLREFEPLALDILADDDPTFGLPQHSAQPTEHEPKYSPTIKAHVAQTLAFLGSFGTRIEAAASIDVAGNIAGIVAKVLASDVTWHRWASLGTGLALLAEASPENFLRAVRRELDKSDGELLRLFRDQGNPLFTGCNHAGLLWALETLAWNAAYVPQVCLVLADLSQRDPGGSWANRPKRSLCEVLSYWMPYTTAGVDERIQAIDLMVKRVPNTAWEILLSLLASDTVSTPTRRPMWREWANSWTPGTTQGDALTFVTAVGERILDLAGLDVVRWKQVIEHFGQLPYTIHDRLLSAVENLSQANLSDTDRRLLSDELAEQISWHRHHHDSFPPQVLDSLERILSDLKPNGVVLRHAWLFDQRPERYFETTEKLTFEEQLLALATTREEALRDIVRQHGLQGISDLTSNTTAPHVVGDSVARVTEDQFLSELIPGWLEGNDIQRGFLGGFVWQRFHQNGWPWADGALSRCGSDQTKAWLLVALPFNGETWQRVADASTAVQRLYWSRCRTFNPELNPECVSTGVHELVKHERPGSAIDLLAMAIHGKKQIDSETLMLALDSLLSLDPRRAKDELQIASAHDLQCVIAALQDRSDVNKARLLRIEWNYLPLYSRRHGPSPKSLCRELSTNPAFFIEVLSLCYRSRKGSSEQQEESQENTAQMAQQAYKLLHEWKQLPGAIASGKVDEDALVAWCSEARRLASEGGRIEACDSHIGQLLAHASDDEDGTWPCGPVRRLIESLGTESIRSGFFRGIMTSRDMVWRAAGGQQDRDLASSFRAKAKRIRFDSPTVAEILLAVADSHEKEGKYWDEQERWDD